MLMIMSSREPDRQRYYKSKEMRIRGFRFVFLTPRKSFLYQLDKFYTFMIFDNKISTENWRDSYSNQSSKFCFSWHKLKML